MGLPDGEEIFVLTQYRLVTDRQTDTLRSLLPALACVAWVKMSTYVRVVATFRFSNLIFLVSLRGG